MPTKIKNLRLKAFQHQQGRCWYCGVQMWHHDPAELPGFPPRAPAACVAPQNICRRGVTAAGMKPATWSPPANTATKPGTGSGHHRTPTPTSRAFVNRSPMAAGIRVGSGRLAFYRSVR